MKFEEHYYIKILNSFLRLVNLNVNEDLNKTWESIQENIKTPFKASLI